MHSRSNECLLMPEVVSNWPCEINKQMLRTLPLTVNVSPLYDVLVTCALRLSDGEKFCEILKGFRARSKRLLEDLSCRHWSLLDCSPCSESGSKMGLPMTKMKIL